MPESLSASATVTTATVTASPSSSSGSTLPIGTFAGVVAVLAALFIGATVAAVYFWVRDSRFRRDHQWSQAFSAAPIAYTTEPAGGVTSMDYQTTTGMWMVLGGGLVC